MSRRPSTLAASSEKSSHAGVSRVEVELEFTLGAHQYRHVRDILLNNRDRLEAANAEWTSPEHANVRGPDYYQ